MPAIWLGAYPDGCVRHGTGRRERLRLPPDPWLRQLLTEVGGASTDMIALRALGGGFRDGWAGTNRDLHNVWLLLQVRPAQQYSSPLTPWSKEAQIQREYHGRPRDCYTLDVTQVCALATPVLLHHRCLRRQHGHRVVGVRPSQPLLIGAWDPSEERMQHNVSWKWHTSRYTDEGGNERHQSDSDGGNADDVVADVASVSSSADLLADVEADSDGGGCGEDACPSQVLEKWGIDTPPSEVPVLFLPEPIVYLVARRRWAQILLLGRWHRHFLADNVVSDLLPGWPPPDSEVWKKELQCEPRVEVPFNLETLADMTNQLQRWAPVLQAAAALPEERQETDMQLENMIQHLECWTDGLKEATGVNTIASSSRFAHTCGQLFTAMRLVFSLRGGAEKLVQAVRLALQLVAPAPMLQACMAITDTDSFHKPFAGLLCMTYKTTTTYIAIIRLQIYFSSQRHNKRYTFEMQ